MNAQLRITLWFSFVTIVLATGFESSAHAQFAREVHRRGVFGRTVDKTFIGSGGIAIAGFNAAPGILNAIPGVLTGVGNIIGRDVPDDGINAPMTRAERERSDAVWEKYATHQAAANALLERTANLVNNLPPVGVVVPQGVGPVHPAIETNKAEAKIDDPWVKLPNLK